MEEVVDSDDDNEDDRFDNQNTTDDSDLISHSISNMKDDAVGLFYKSHRFAKGNVPSRNVLGLLNTIVIIIISYHTQ